MKTKAELKPVFKYWEIIADMIDQSIDIMLNLSQSGHPGGSRSKVHALVVTLLSGAMKWDIRNPGKRFSDRFILSAGHTNPAVYGALAVFNEALRRKYNSTGDTKYLNPKGADFTLTWEDILTLRKIGGLSGHAEMEGKTLFFKANTGPSGHGFPMAAGQAFALKHAGYENVKVFALEGEGGLTAGVTHETRNSAYGLGLGNLVTLVDWNNFGIDDRPFSDVIHGTPDDWFKPYGWKVVGTENGSNFESLVGAYSELLADESDKPKVLWFKTQKGRGYGVFDNASHGAPHKRNSELFWNTKLEFSEKYNLKFDHINKLGFDDYESNRDQMADCMETVMSLFDNQDGLLDYLADTLIEFGESVSDNIENNKFDKNPLDDSALYDYKNFPIYKTPGEKAPNRAGFAAFGSWVNTFSKQKYGRPLFLVSSADLAGSTNISGFSKGYDGAEDFGMYNRETNPKGVLLPQAITEFANAGIMAGISSVNLSSNPYDEFNGYLTASSTYGAFAYLKYGIMRIYSQMAQDSQLKLGKTIWVAGHSGPETGEDSRTHFGIFSPGVTQLFPEGQILNLHPWEYNEVPVMLAESLKTDIPIIVLHLTRPPVVIPDREKLGISSHFEASKGAYIIRDYDSKREKEGIVIIRGTKATEELITLLPKFEDEGPNVKIISASSYGLFKMQSEEYQNSIIAQDEWNDAMIITNSGINLMSNWIKNPIVKHYSVSADWDNKWRSGGSINEVLDEAHLTAKWQWLAILKFALERNKRIQQINQMTPNH
ncbi:MAG: transketolase [Candidatus Marinimicrobia bacterium]|nr:transketolase [Candidatus Neomarinimicrobiota bacterium]MBL7023682.1 transketolase [Candidatus Neomarinimicrobiota bacterium]